MNKLAPTVCPLPAHRSGTSGRSRMLLLLAGSLLALASGQALASCTSTLPGGGGGNYTFPGFTASLDPNQPVGTVLYSTTVSMNIPVAYSATCTSLINVINHQGYPGTPSGKIYPTSIAGVGYRMKYIGSATRDYFPVDQPMPYNTTNASLTASIAFELVKTGRITSGGSIRGVVGRAFLPAHNFTFFTMTIAGSITVQPLKPTCQVATTSVTLDAGTVARSSFKKIGDESPLGPASNIRVTCSGGTGGGRAGVYIVMTDAVDKSNRTDLLPLGTGSTAAGVGVRLRRSTGDSVKFGPDSATVGAANQWKVGDAATGSTTLNVPLQAQMVQTGASVTQGSVRATATFTMGYN